MGISFSGSDIIDIAIHIEKNGVEFYKYALSAVKQADLQDCFRRLADMEQKHISVFQELCDICHEKCRNEDPDNPAVCYLKAFVRGHGLDASGDPAQVLADLHTPQDILKKAIVAEKDSIALYTGIKAFIADDSCGREKIDRVLAEEMNHLAELSECLERLTEASA